MVRSNYKKNYREVLKTCGHIEKPANEGIPILKPVGPSYPCKTAKKLKNFRQQLNTTQNPRQLKLSNPHIIILGHLNINFLRNKFESIADVI